MLIDVQDPLRKVMLNACLYGVACSALLSFILWARLIGPSAWPLSLPLLAFALYIAYEIAMPPNWDIRVDPLMLFPLLGMTGTAGLLRVASARWRRQRAGKQ